MSSSPHLTARSLGTALVGLMAVGLTGCEHALSSIGAGERERASDEWVRSYTLADGGEVQVININGRIEVEPSAGASVEVRAERIGRGSDEAAARAALETIEIQEDVTSDRVALETRVPKGGLFGQGTEVRYFLKVPAGAAVTLHTVNGEVDVSGITGPVSLETTNGRVQGRELGGEVSASTTNGRIAIDVTRIGENGIDLETTNGRIALEVPETAAADVSARLGNGSIRTSGLSIAERGEPTKRRLEGTLNGGGPTIHLRTTNGSISLSGRS